MLFELGDNFKNYDGYFKNLSNQEIRTSTICSRLKPKSIDDLENEYDYLIRTDNFGLVMKWDIFPNERKIK